MNLAGYDVSDAIALPAKHDYGIGLVGCGGIVNYAHLPAYRKAGLRVVACYDQNREAAERTAAVIRAGRDHGGQQLLPVGNGKADIDETGARHADIGDLGIVLQLGDDEVGKRPRIEAERLGKNHRRIGRDVAMALVARRLDADSAEIEL